jgi:AraC-like DNA-binding protein
LREVKVFPVFALLKKTYYQEVHYFVRPYSHNQSFKYHSKLKKNVYLFCKSLFKLLLGWLKIYIRNMVCIRCKMVVKSELEKLGLHYTSVELGEAVITEDISPEKMDRLRIALKKTGLELMDNKKSILVEKIKTIIIEMVHYTDEQIKTNLSDYLSEKLKYNYTYLANLFSEVKGTTIEQFYLAHKIEKVKELLVYDELNLTQIAWKLHYSSVAHLSNQFKKMTGLTPSHFKNLKNKRRRTLGNV